MVFGNYADLIVECERGFCDRVVAWPGRQADPIRIARLSEVRPVICHSLRKRLICRREGVPPAEDVRTPEQEVLVHVGRPELRLERVVFERVCVEPAPHWGVCGGVCESAGWATAHSVGS